MAKGNPRSSKRSSASSSSCPSTLTTAIFVSLCVLGVWFLSSNSYSRPQAASKSSNAKAHTTKISSSIASSRDDSRRVIPSIGEKNLAHEDVSGMLPDDDAVKSSDVEKQDDANEIHNESNGSAENDVDASNELQSNENQETELEKNDEPIGDDGAKNEAEEEVSNGGRESAEEEEKQSSLETQTSEESSVTHIEQVKETKNEEDQDQGDHSSSDDNNNTEDLQRKDSGEETSVDDSHQEAITETKTEEDQGADAETVKNEDRESESLENQISKEDEDKRLQEHQQQEDDQVQERKSKKDPNGAISNSQIEHDEAPLDEDGPRAMEETSKSSEEDSAIKSTMSSKKEDEVEEASFPDKESTEIPKESKESKKAWSTQRDESTNQKERGTNDSSNDKNSSDYGHTWHLCNETAGADYIPCLDNEKAISKLHSRKHHEHRERHCPEDASTCLVPLPKGYKTPVQWPQSRDKIWFHNVPHTSLANVKGHQNWVKVTGEFLTFPGGGTQFIHGAMHYIDFIQEAVPDIAWGKHTRVILDVGCGVASFGGYLFDRDVLAMSFAPKDEHEAQVQFALERGIPAISAVMGSQRLPFPSKVFDIVHCARCRVPWHADGGALLLELNRVLRPGGYFVWSATPVYQKLDEDVQIWQEMSNLTVAMCWELVTIKKDKINMIGAAVYQKPDSNDCYEQRKQKQPPMCKNGDDPNAAWYVPLQSCMHRVPTEESERGSQWPEEWPDRLQTPPYWLNKSQMGIYGKPAPEDFSSDLEHWKKVVNKLYMNGLGISWSNVRNVMDMRAVYGGFAAALKDLKIWVMNVVNVDSPDTLPIIYERGLFGIYHDWCESFSTYPRTYDLLHADHLFSRLKTRCKLVGVMAEIDRIVRPGGILIVRDDSSTVGEAENLLKSLQWEVHLTYSQNKEGILSAQKSNWRPTS